MQGGLDIKNKRTNSVRALIVGHDDVGRCALRTLLASDEDVEIVGAADSALEARRWIVAFKPDLVLIDVGMPDSNNSIEPLRDVPEPLPYVIIVSAYTEFACRAFDLRADDFLVMPVQRQRLSESMQRAKRRIAERRIAGYALQIADAAFALNGLKIIRAAAPFGRYARQMTIRVRRRMFSIDVDNIMWIQGASQYCRVHAKNGEYLLARTLASLECELDPTQFFRIHRSAIVNAAHVREVRSRGDGCYNVYLQGGQSLPMGRARLEILHKLLGSLGSGETRPYSAA